MSQTVQKPSRSRLNQLARELGYILGAKETTKLIDQAMVAAEPEKFLREQAAQSAGKDQSSPNDEARMTNGAAAAGDDAEAGMTVDQCAVVALPLGSPPPPPAYARRFQKVELALDADQAAIFQRLYYGLNSRSMRLASGRHIESAADVLRFILEQAALAAEGK